MNQEGFKENVQNTVNKKLDQDIKFCILEYLQSGIKRALRKMCRLNKKLDRNVETGILPEGNPLFMFQPIEADISLQIQSFRS